MMTATVTAALTYQASRKSVVAQSSTRLGGYIAKAVSELVAQEWKTKRCQYFLKVLARLTAVSTNHSHVRCSRSIWQQLFSYRWMRHGVVVVCCGCVLCANWVSCWTGLMLQQLTQLAQGTQSSPIVLPLDLVWQKINCTHVVLCCCCWASKTLWAMGKLRMSVPFGKTRQSRHTKTLLCWVIPASVFSFLPC